MKKHLPAALTAVALVVLVSVIAPSHRAIAAGTYTLEPAPFGMQLKTPDGRVVFEYLTKKPDGLTSPSAACFHPVNTPTGERVTSLAPDDHPHHRGMYIAWEDAEFRQPLDPARRTPTSSLYGWSVTKADFWGWGQYAPREGRVIQNRSIKLASADAAKAQVEIHNDWNVDARKMADETTTATVAERDGVYVIDVVFRLAVLVDFQLNKQAFSGFNFQARKDGQSHYTYPGGVVTLPDGHYSVPELNWPSAPWYGYVIALTSGKTVGAAVLDHPSNPPTTWHGSRGLWMLNPNIAALWPVTIKTDAPLTLRYRVVVHDGDTPTALLNKLSDEWRAMTF
jgi:hypothetical protein